MTASTSTRPTSMAGPYTTLTDSTRAASGNSGAGQSAPDRGRLRRARTTPFSNRLADPTQGRPANQALHEAYYPSSFIVQADDDVIVWPAMRSSSPGSLGDVLPDEAHSWPDWNRQVQR